MDTTIAAPTARPAPGHYQERLSAVLSSGHGASTAVSGWWSSAAPPRRRPDTLPRRRDRQTQLALPLGRS